MVPHWHLAPVTCEWSNRMSENSCVSENQVLPVDQVHALSDLELRILTMFRSISGQYQRDVVRMLEAFVQLEE